MVPLEKLDANNVSRLFHDIYFMSDIMEQCRKKLRAVLA